MKRITQVAQFSPLLWARIAGAAWVYCIVAGIWGFFPGKGTHLGQDAVLTAQAAYLVVTVVLYVLLRPVDPNLALLAAAFGVVTIPSSEVFYSGIQCIVVGYLIAKSTFIPRTIGILMVIAGIGQIVGISTLLPTHPAWLSRFGFISDGIGEASLALWLLIMGVNAAKWYASAGGPQPATASKGVA